MMGPPFLLRRALISALEGGSKSEISLRARGGKTERAPASPRRNASISSREGRSKLEVVGDGGGEEASSSATAVVLDAEEATTTTGAEMGAGGGGGGALLRVFRVVTFFWRRGGAAMLVDRAERREALPPA